MLHQFPLEANIAAHFEMLDQRMEEALFAEARRDMITGAAREGRPQLAAAFATILERGGEFGLDMLLGEIVHKRDGLRDLHRTPARRRTTGPFRRFSRNSVLGPMTMLPRSPRRSGLCRDFERGLLRRIRERCRSQRRRQGAEQHPAFGARSASPKPIRCSA